MLQEADKQELLREVENWVRLAASGAAGLEAVEAIHSSLHRPAYTTTAGPDSSLIVSELEGTMVSTRHLCGASLFARSAQRVPTSIHLMRVCAAARVKVITDTPAKHVATIDMASLAVSSTRFGNNSSALDLPGLSPVAHASHPPGSSSVVEDSWLHDARSGFSSLHHSDDVGTSYLDSLHGSLHSSADGEGELGGRLATMAHSSVITAPAHRSVTRQREDASAEPHGELHRLYRQGLAMGLDTVSTICVAAGPYGLPVACIDYGQRCLIIAASQETVDEALELFEGSFNRVSAYLARQGPALAASVREAATEAMGRTAATTLADATQALRLVVMSEGDEQRQELAKPVLALTPSSVRTGRRDEM